MVNNYSKIVSVDMAKELLKFGMPLHKYTVYNDGKPYFDIPDYGQPGWEEGDRYRIPTYGEVFDWFANEKYICITLEPYFAIALRGHIAFTWKVAYPDIKLGLLVIKDEGDNWIQGMPYGGSFTLTADDAIKYAMTVKVPDSKEDTSLA